MTTVLAGDIGGTKTILRLVQVGDISLGKKCPKLSLIGEETYPSRSFPDLVPMIKKFLATINTEIKLEKACFGIAGPVINNTSELTNLRWVLNSDRLAKELDIKQVELINDFQAIGYGVLTLETEDIHTLQSAPSDANAPIAVLGAGTGLGQGFLIPLGEEKYRVFPSEGAHGDFSPRSDLEFQLVNYIKEKFQLERVSIERVVSGQGIAAIYQFLRDQNPSLESPQMAKIYETWEAELGKSEKTVDLAAAVSQGAHSGSDYLCEQTMKLFMEAYGCEAGNLALKLLPYGGVYIAGGIAGKNLDLITQGHFMQTFHQKGRLSPLMAKFPVYVVLNPKVGLMGAALRAFQLEN
ncbi:glucokinase [Gloeocapsa sp. PCC 73106]|uniref:glucokinase n=1 Tax=Gloeocapsa sp. PCC 73106 TaxID=102232 RepID=UPI0002AC3046|nr:glucokinase [Gloeocapsa sp. PCC 73106]ELR97165.1 glucokinase [Gloeocapsa sp. PCC 73106]